MKQTLNQQAPKAARSRTAARKHLKQQLLPAASKRFRELSRTDILMSIKPEHINNIVSQVKNHEYRNYLLPKSVIRIWLYTSAPTQQIRYIAAVGPGRQPGEVEEDGGLGNEDFNAGRKVSKFGYKILQLWELRHPLSLVMLKSKGYLNGPPQKYCWAPQAMLVENRLDEQKLLFSRTLDVPSAEVATIDRPRPGPDIRKFFT
jgi:hypothetical protein